VKNIVDWIEENKLPNVFMMNGMFYRYLYNHKNPFMVLFIQNAVLSSNLIKQYELSSRNPLLKTAISHSICDMVDYKKPCKHLIDNIGIHEDELPVLFIIENLATKRIKYRMNVG